MSHEDEKRTQDEGAEVEGQMRRRRADPAEAKEPEELRRTRLTDDDDDTPDVEGHHRARRAMRKNRS